MAVANFTHGRVTIEYDPAGPEGSRVLRSGISVQGAPLIDALRSAAIGPATGSNTPEAKTRSLMVELYDAIWAFDNAVPRNTLAFRDLADRIHEAVVSPVWVSKSQSGENQAALDYCLWTLRVCEAWESSTPSSLRYIHKGTPFYFAAISALRLRNIDLGLMLLERGDHTDTETYNRAGISTTGIAFPGRSTLSFSPEPSNLLYNDVVAMRKIVDVWLKEFTTKSGIPIGYPLNLSDLDSFLFGDTTLITEARYLFAFLVWTNCIQEDPVLAEARFCGPLTRRRQAEWLLGLLTATEGLVRTAESSTRVGGNYSDVVTGLIAKSIGPNAPPTKKLRKTLDNIANSHRDDPAKCLDYWAKWSPSGPTAGFPWWIRWIESGRFLRNQTAHLLEAPASLGSRWVDFERTVKFALFSAVWLHTRRASTARSASTNVAP